MKNELMSAADFAKLLRKISACEEACEWAKGKTLAEVWATCERGDWMLWLVGYMNGKKGWATQQQVVLAACDCAELSLKYVAAGEARPRIAIETARKWARGEATIEEVTDAAHAAHDAYAAAYAAAHAAAAYAAYAAAYAAYAAAYAAYAAYAAAAYAAYAAYAYAAAYDAAYDAASYEATRNEILKQCADLVRKSIPVPYQETNK
jgi:hypothetical protein